MPASRDHGARSGNAAEHAAGQQRGEIDIQIAIDAAAGPLDAQLADREIGRVAELDLDFSVPSRPRCGNRR